MKTFLFAAALLFNLPAMAQSYELFFKKGEVQAIATFAEAPTSSANATMVLEFRDAATQAPYDLTEQLAVVLWMPDMGHGSRPVKIERALGASGNVLPGIYQISKMSFMMNGPWEVKVTLKDAEGNSETQTFAIEI